jgi:hypothetical protein
VPSGVEVLAAESVAPDLAAPPAYQPPMAAQASRTLLGEAAHRCFLGRTEVPVIAGTRLARRFLGVPRGPLSGEGRSGTDGVRIGKRA